MKQTNSERYQQQKPYKKKTSLAPLSARLLPRLARALKGCFFVQLCRGRKAAPALVSVAFFLRWKFVHYNAELFSSFNGYKIN
jgi:hypothetical protein